MIKITANYKDHRNEIKSGDLLIWSKDNISTLSNSYLKIIRFLTSSEYAHVGIAVRIFSRLFVLEATTPFIRLAPVSTKDEFYHIPLDIKWKIEYYDYLFTYIGCKYSLFDAVRAYLGKVAKDDNNKWQCVELAVHFYRKIGIDFGDNFTPSKFVKSVLEISQKPMYFIKNE
jgi:hypothetical protein